ncbi:DinB family protein [uncultured Mucilaginibacter sp.]|uniref:DinB family protein n=1 Tax=uncultured Mucilaginibacter sp. TaxID=797541 RepID=UPI0025D73078|nr:DinB family protein [uncultured Mucilaginibacter sp.]
MNDITFAQSYISELEAETNATRKCLERIPVELFSWKPHPKSMELGYLALLVAEIPLWITHMIYKDYIDYATFEHLKPTTTQELVTHFDENVKGARKALMSVENGQLDAKFDLKGNGQVMFTSTKRHSLESTINHMVHHRGQLTVYMRLNDIAVPAIYGPSADDRNF